MMTAGRRGRERIVAVALTIFIVFAHVLAWYFVARYVNVGTDPDKPALVVITGTVLLAWSLLISQAMESVTRAFYARSDLDLILSSPAAARKIFAVRIGAMALSVILMAALLGAPLINVLVARGGAHWLGAYGVVVAMGATASAGAVALTVLLFRLIGPRRTRLAAQIVAAVIAARIHHRAAGRRDPVARHALAHGVSRIRHAGRAGAGDRQSRLVAGARRARRPDRARRRARRKSRAAWWRDRRLLGTVRRSCDRGIGRGGDRTRRQRVPLFRRPLAGARAAAEGMDAAAARSVAGLADADADPLLLPPALLLWRSFGEGTGALVVLVPVLVMAAGQLAGGLAWLAISGEDAPDLVATAPVPRAKIVRAKIEAVLGAIAIAFAPFIAALTFLSVYGALVSALGILAAAAAATAIQFFFRKQAVRRYFRHRQTASRFATFAEAFSSIAWAATAAIAAGGSWLALFPAGIGLAILAAARWMSPHKL